MDAAMEDDRPNIEDTCILCEQDPTWDVHINYLAGVLQAQNTFIMIGVW